jgi:hypothetical protein
LKSSIQATITAYFVTYALSANGTADGQSTAYPLA